MSTVVKAMCLSFPFVTSGAARFAFDVVLGVPGDLFAVHLRRQLGCGYFEFAALSRSSGTKTIASNS